MIKYKCGYINEVELIEQFEKLLNQISISEIGMKSTEKIKVREVGIRDYAKFILKDGSIEEKRELLTCFKSKIWLKNKFIFLSN